MYFCSIISLPIQSFFLILPPKSNNKSYDCNTDECRIAPQYEYHSRDDENLLRRAAKYLRKLAAEKEDPTLMTKEEFFARVDKAREEIRQGKGKRFSNPEEMNAWLNSL